MTVVWPALLVDPDTGRSFSRAQIRTSSVTFGQGLKHLYNWQKGDVLAFFTPNNIDTPVVNLGLHWAGGVASPANPSYGVREMTHQLKDCGAKAIITQVAMLDMALKVVDHVGVPRDRVFLMGQQRKTGFKHWTDITPQSAVSIKPEKTSLNPSTDLAYLVYSSVSLCIFPAAMASAS